MELGNITGFSFYHSYFSIVERFTVNRVLIYLPSLKLYQLFDSIATYSEYVETMNQSEYNIFLAKRLVLISEPHKFTIICNNNSELISRISNIVDCLPEVTTISDSLVQLMFNKAVSSCIQEETLFSIIKQLDSSIRIIRHDKDNKFLEVNHCNKYISYKLDEILKKVDNIKPVININDSGDYHNIVVYGNNTSTNTVNNQSNESIVRDWITSNPFEGRMEQSQYRNKFLEDTKIVIHPNTWGKYAKGLLISKTSNGRSYYEFKKIN